MIKTIYTNEQWAKDRNFNAKPGQEVVEDIYYEMLDCVPPRVFSTRLFLVGEPYDHFGEDGAARYSLFFRHNNKYYYGGEIEANSKKIHERINTLISEF